MLLDRVFVSGGKAFELEYNLLSNINVSYNKARSKCLSFRDQLGDAGIGFLVETELGRPSFRMEIREVPEKCRIIEKREQELFLKDKSESVLYRFIVPFAYFAGPGKDDILRLYPFA